MCYIATRLRAGWSGFRIQAEARVFLLSKIQDRFWGPPRLLFNWYRGLFSGSRGAASASRPISTLQLQGREKGQLHTLYIPLLCLHGADAEDWSTLFIYMKRWTVILQSTASIMGPSNILLTQQHLSSNSLEIQVRTSG
jgi:hypothetical protein